MLLGTIFRPVYLRLHIGLVGGRASVAQERIRRLLLRLDARPAGRGVLVLADCA